jgi:ketosteroid isomerase-like protein
MKCVALCILSLLLAGSSSSRTLAQTSDEAAIHEIFSAFFQAIHDRSVDRIMSFYAPKVIAFDVVPPLQYAGSAAYRKDWQQFFAAYKGPVTDHPSDVHIVVDGSLAYSADVERVSGMLTSGQKNTLTVRVTDVYQKLAGRWLIVHEHVSVPVDLNTGKAILNAQ